MRKLHTGRAAYGGRTRVVPLPGAGQINIAHGALLNHIGAAHATVGDFMPQQATGLRAVDRLGQHKSAHVTHLAVGIFGQGNVVDDGVLRQRGIQLAKSAPGDLFVGHAARSVSGQRLGFIDHDTGDACLRSAQSDQQYRQH